MNIYTRMGDSGFTANLRGQRISKNDTLMHLIGAIDELNSHLGLIKTMFSGGENSQFIEETQKNLMKLMAHVSDTENEKYLFSNDKVDDLEKEIDKLLGKSHKQFELVLPGKNASEAHIHIARTVARRAERLFFAANENQTLCQTAGAYLNRLSDYLFVLSQME